MTLQKQTKSALEIARTFASLLVEPVLRQELLRVKSEEEFRNALKHGAQALATLQTHPPHAGVGKLSNKVRHRFGLSVILKHTGQMVSWTRHSRRLSTADRSLLQ